MQAVGVSWVTVHGRRADRLFFHSFMYLIYSLEFFFPVDFFVKKKRLHILTTSVCYICADILGHTPVLLHMCAWTANMCPHSAPWTRHPSHILVCMDTYVCSYCYICVLKLLHMCPHNATHVPSYCYRCPHTAACSQHTSDMWAGRRGHVC